jgi:hypothetical protein
MTPKGFYEASIEQPFIWGQSCCTAWPREWLRLGHGIELDLPEWRSREQALDHIEQAGSLVNLWENALAKVGLYRGLGEPEPGAVGIIGTHSAGDIGGVFLEHRIIAVRMEPKGSHLIRVYPRNIRAFWQP